MYICIYVYIYIYVCVCVLCVVVCVFICHDNISCKIIISFFNFKSKSKN